MLLSHRSETHSRGAPVIVIAAVVALGVEAVAMSAGNSPAIAATALLAVVAVAVLARVSLVSLGVGSAVLSAFTLPWNGWIIGGVRPGDALLLIALLCFLAADIGGELPRLPRWVTQAGIVTVIVISAHELIPTDPRYLANRVVVTAAGTPFPELQTNLGVGPKLLVAVIALPLTFCFAVRREPRILRWLAVAYVAGTSTSGLVAFSDGRGISALGQQITGNVNIPTREAGFSDHPNFLAASCVLAIGLCLWLLIQPGIRNRLLGLVLLPGILLGTYASGSRGGAVCVVIVVVLFVLITPQLRPYLPATGVAATIIAISSFVLYPSFGSMVLKATRLSGGTASTEGSDAVRALVGAQGVADFSHSPIDGVGFQVAAEAQNVYLQQLAAGGLLLFVALLILASAAISVAYRLRTVSDLAGPLFVSLVGAAALNLVGSSLTDRFFYVPLGLVVALHYHYRQPGAMGHTRSAAGSLSTTPGNRSHVSVKCAY